jgi:hypothetical protein
VTKSFGTQGGRRQRTYKTALDSAFDSFHSSSFSDTIMLTCTIGSEVPKNVNIAIFDAEHIAPEASR